MPEVAVVLDASTLLAYAEGQIAAGELIAEVSDEGRVADGPGAAFLLLLITTSTAVVLPLGADEAGRFDRVWRVGAFARAAGGDVGIGHAVCAALEQEAYYATTEPKRAAGILPPGWGVIDLGASMS